ncbi:MAG: threonine/serine dehydratase [Longimicrobiales bacterium]
MVSLQQIEDARSAIADRIHRTPLISSNTLGRRTGTRAYLKAECLQRTGSFKVRGGLNRVRTLSQDERDRGLVAVSAGNHAQAVAFAATAAGAESTVVMPEAAPRSKVEASRRYGANVILHGTVFEAWNLGLELSRERGLTFIHPYDDPDIIAGQGTAGLEIVEDLPDVDVVVVPVGGGGLISGIAAAVKRKRPSCKMIGVEPVGAASLTAALAAGKPVTLDTVSTIADGLAAPHAGELVLEHARALIDDVVLVSDEEIAQGLLFVLERAKLMLEPAGAAGVAALLCGRINPKPDQRVAVVLSGGNIDLQRLRQLLPAGADEDAPAAYGALKG